MCACTVKTTLTACAQPGFEVARIDLADRIPAEEYARYRLPVGEPLFVVRKA